MTKKPAKPRKPPAKRTRPISIRAMANTAEKKTLMKAAKKAGRPMTRWVLEAALEKAMDSLTEKMAALKKRDEQS
jgi:uncharacterized protein (DUF1778 family)